MLRRLSLFLLLILLASPALAQDMAPDTTYRRNILWLPALGATPETGFLFGGIVIPQFKVGGAPADTRSSSIMISALYTFKNQILIGIFPDLILPHEKWVLTGNYFVNYFPQDYWGVGLATGGSDRVKTLFTKISLDQTVLRNLGSNLFVGPIVRYSRMINVRFRDLEENPLPAPSTPGTSGSTMVGFGVVGRIDRRASNMTPTEHYFVEMSLQTYPSALGTTHPYSFVKLDARKYLNLSGDGRSVLALQGVTRMTHGRPPFQELSPLGGDLIGRGYYDGRYRDQNAAQIQAEWRRHVVGIFGVTVFASAGRVWDRFEELSANYIRPAGGAGLRFNLNKNDPTNLRVDFGVGHGGTGFYIQFGEAF